MNYCYVRSGGEPLFENYVNILRRDNPLCVINDNRRVVLRNVCIDFMPKMLKTRIRCYMGFAHKNGERKSRCSEPTELVSLTLYNFLITGNLLLGMVIPIVVLNFKRMKNPDAREATRKRNPI